MPRKGYKKSRFGCTNCKRRHRRCDEGLPSCMNCMMANDACSYLLPSSIRPPGKRIRSAQATPAPDAVPQDSTTISHEAESPSSEPSVSQSTLASRPNLRHLYLLSLYMRDPEHLIGLPRYGGATRNLDLVLKYAFRHDWLMAILLAFTALRQTIDEGGNAELYQESMEQLDIGIQGFTDAMKTISSETISTNFLTSGLVGSHLLCDTFALPHDETPDDFLMRIIRTINVMRGTRALLRDGNWELIKSSDLAPLLDLEILMAPNGTDEKTSHFEKLHSLYESSSLDNHAKEDCKEAVVQLLKTYGSDNEDAQIRRLSRVKRARAWPAVVSGTYTELLLYRSPEALIILAHWAVLLHDLESEWPIRGSGDRIVTIIEGILGDSWKEWLIWPREMVNRPA
ncbi:L-arabinose-responsive transcription regulator ARA1-like protein [Elsinoe fawcettii]|nr:L-arabinose-responsive transcription regulator ARA1-like protein [Elsinoe fawcettii]